MVAQIEHKTMQDEVYTTTQDEVTALSNMKHPLHHTWSYWFYTNKSKDWETNLVELTTFAAVEDYWCLYHHMKLPSELRLGQDYAVFKQGVRPMWEDMANKKGGRWLISGLKSATVNRIWNDTVLMIIGENFVNSDAICGVVVNVRAESKVCVWTRDKDQKTNMEIGQKLKQVLGLRKVIQFQPHNKSNYLYSV